VAEDGRIPISIKVVLRKFDSQKKSSHRETKQANILPSLFKTSVCPGETGVCKVQLADGALDKLLKIIMRLFERIVDLNKPFNITLIGLAFSKFQERRVGSSSIANFLIKKADLEVQSITSLTNTSLTSPTADGSPTAMSGDEAAFRSSPTTFKPSDQFYRRRATTASPVPMLIDNGSESAATNSDFSDFSETEVEPSPKKSRIGRVVVSKRSRLAVDVADTAADVASPSKLRVCDLRLNSRDSEKDFPMSPIAACTPSTSGTASAPRFRTIQPPNTLLNRIDGSLRFMPARTASRMSSNASSTASSPLPSPMDDTVSAPSTPTIAPALQVAAPAPNDISAASTEAATGDSLSHIACPAGVDAQVFKELPVELQNELIASWRSSLVVAAASAVEQATTSSGSVTNPASTSSGGGGGAGGTQKNTLYRYFLRNK